MELTYRAGVGELIWAMTTTRPDLAFASVKLSQANYAPAATHFHGLKHALKYLYSTKDDGIYFWRTAHQNELQLGPPPPISSNKQDLLMSAPRPEHAANIAHAYADSDWGTCVKTRRSFGGSVIRLAGGTIAYKSKFQPTVAGSSTEAEFMAAYDTGKMILFIRRSYGTLTYHKKRRRSSTKIMMLAPQWETHRSQHLEPATSISKHFRFVNGLNGT